MAFNCSSPNASLAAAPPATTSDYTQQCNSSRLATLIIDSFTLTCLVFLLPVYVFILCLGFQQWRQQSFSTVAMSHFDLFTYHMVLLETLNVVACVCMCSDVYTNSGQLKYVGYALSFLSTSGQIFFQNLTCAERFLAVVHPVTYLRLKGEKWNRVRNTTICFIWLFSILMTLIVFLSKALDVTFFLYSLTVLQAFLMFVFSVSVLLVLSRSGPSEGKGVRHRVGPEKLRASYIILFVLVVVALKLLWNVASSLLTYAQISQMVLCLFLSLTFWVSLPSSLLMPLLYLQRKQRLVFCRKKNEAKHPQG